MEPKSLDAPPGVLKNESVLASAGRYIDSLNVRFWNGKPEKIGGYVHLLDPSLKLSGTVDALFSWAALNSATWIAAGTDKKLYAIGLTDLTPLDITPEVNVMSAVANPLNTTVSSPTVRVTMVAHQALVGQIVNISLATAVGGITPNGAFAVKTIIDANNFTFDFTSNATGSAAGGGMPRVALELPAGGASVIFGLGWGAGGWGSGTWGTPRTSSTIVINPRFWSLQNFGQLLLSSVQDAGQYIFSWDPSVFPVQRAQSIGVGPLNPEGFIVTTERTIVAWGTNFGGTKDLMQFWTCGQGVYTDWDVTLQVSAAGGVPSISRRLQEGNRIMGARDLANNVHLIWTDTALYLNQYRGDQLAYSTRLVEKNSGLIGPEAAVVVDGKAYWVTNNSFKMYDGSVNDIPGNETISQWVFGQVRNDYLIKTRARYNVLFSEIIFSFVVGDDESPSLEVAYSIGKQTWTPNVLRRTAACNVEANLRLPVMAGEDGQLYKHEVGHDADGAPLPWSLTRAPERIGTGRNAWDVFEVYVDMQRQTNPISLALTCYDRSPSTLTQTDATTGTIAPGNDRGDLTNAVQGRLIGITYSGGTEVEDDFRFGMIELGVANAGART